MPVITFSPGPITVKVAPGTTILEAARLAHLVIESPCNGIGTCGKCRVQIDQVDAHLLTIHGRHHSPVAETAQGWVLACQASIQGDISVQLPTTTSQALNILQDGHTLDIPITPAVGKRYDDMSGETVVIVAGREITREYGDSTASLYGVVVDIGTTTLVVALIDLQTGQELAAHSALNPQSLHAQDVLSRISLAATTEGLRLLHGLVIDEINHGIGALCTRTGIPRESIYEVVFSGNTSMLHLATGTDPSTLGKYPYRSTIVGDEYRDAAATGLAIAPGGVVYLPPIISGFVGADITAGLLASQLHRATDTVLFVDIGTNGEMALAHGGRLIATSTAAGPAFEGMNITHGMRAGHGAIDTFVIREDGTVSLTTLGQAPAQGICGSGLVDIVGALVAHGAITSPGRFASPDDPALSPDVRARLFQREGKTVFDLADGVWLTQKDIRQVQLAKGAIRAGIDALLRHVGIAAAVVDRVLIAGSFGYHLRAQSLLDLGLLPPEFAGKVTFIGNTSKTGGQALLINQPSRAEMQQVVGAVESVELADAPEFQQHFVRCLGFEEGYRRGWVAA